MLSYPLPPSRQTNTMVRNEQLYARGAGLILLLSLQLVSTTTSSPHSISTPNRLAFYPRGGSVVTSSSSSSATSCSTLISRRRNKKSLKSIQTVGLRRKTAKKAQTLDFEEEYYDYNPQSQTQEPSLEELRAQLGPIGTLVSNTIELTVTTVGSYISGAALGYVGGGVMSVPSTLFGKHIGGISQRLSAVHGKALVSCKSWATLSAAFSGFHNFVRLCRGGNEDHWNAVWGSALTGAFLNRAGGPQAMIQGGATYAGFTYFLDKFFASPSSKQAQQ